MYNNSHPDPYAGQYPPPPPLQSPVVEQPSNVSIPMLQQAYQPQQQSFTPPTQQESYPPMHSHNNYQPPQEVYPPTQPPQEMYPPRQQDVYSPPPPRNDFYNQPQPQPYYNSHVAITPLDEERHLTGVNDYHRDNSLDDYLRQEREEYLKHENNSKQNQITPYYNKEEEDNEKEKTPMVLKESSPPSRKERKRIEKLKKQHQDAMMGAYITKPTLAPENEAESYRPKPYAEEKRSNCCCCYNPAITCCSFFCLLISITFFAAGVALMIASKVVTDKCNSQCENVIDQAQNACGTLCSKVLHDGMLYGGAVVAGLAGIAIVWKLIMWTCAGYSKR